METNRPRHYLFAYIAADGDKKKQGEALAGMPVEFRPLLTTYIGIHKERNNGTANSLHGTRISVGR